jgi:hypothetical protein
MMGKAQMTVYPDPQTGRPRPTLQWEIVRIGINDLRYLLTLDKALEAAGKQVDEALAGRVNAFKESLAESYPVSTKGAAQTAEKISWEDFEGVREEASKLIGDIISY